ITQILSHPSEEYRSYYDRYENLSEDIIKRIRNLRTIREKVLEIFRQTSPELCEKIKSTEQDLFSTIKLTDQQEKLEPVDLILIDSALKNICTHLPRCYEKINFKDPVAFARSILSCPNVSEILGNRKDLKGRIVSLLIARIGRLIDTSISIYCEFYI
ncbi:MAG: hypothetical protein QXU67_07050, partial [Candidatus Bathyarchaeia archaeon]